jgi:hypothetical protein
MPQHPASQHPNGVPGKPHEAANETPGSDMLAGDDEFRRELERLAADHRELLAAVGLKPTAASEAAPAGEADALEAEILELRARVAELERLASDSDEAFADRQKEYEALLEEKSEVIRGLHQQLVELRQGGPAVAGGGGEAAGEPAMPDDLTGLKVQLQRERQQLREDEEALMQQMTEMELTMARERAELARQRAELQRLHNDIRHELEVAGRDGTLRDRLAVFQRRHHELTGRKGAPRAEPAPAGEAPPVAAPVPEAPKRNTSGLLGRLFGSGNA